MKNKVNNVIKLIILILAVIVILVLVGKKSLIENTEKSKKTSIETENEKIRLTYEVGERTGNDIKVLIEIIAQEGIREIHTPEPDIIYVYGGIELAIDYIVKLDVEYKFIIISETGEEKQEIIRIEPQIETTTVFINETQNAITSLPEYSVEKGTPLYINFEATLEGEIFTIEPPLSQAITSNGLYTYIMTGKYNGRIITATKEVMVKQYNSARDIVKYDAGEWTKEEIEELKNQKLYDINVDKTISSQYKINSETGFNLTFGGFTYKGDSENENNINEKKVITNRNQSISNENGYGRPKYDGWQILETEGINGKTYVKKLIHAGSPENFSSYTFGTRDEDMQKMRKICFTYYIRWKV